MATDNKTTLNLEEIKKNLLELRHRLESHVNPEYEIHKLYNPETRRMETKSMTRLEWWQEWHRQESWLPKAHRNPFKRLGEIRAGTDDYVLNQIGKIMDDFLQQVDLLSQFMALQAKEKHAVVPVAAQSAQAADQEVIEYDLPVIEEEEPPLAVPIKALPALPADEPETGAEDDDEEAAETLEPMDEEDADE